MRLRNMDLPTFIEYVKESTGAAELVASRILIVSILSLWKMLKTL